MPAQFVKGLALARLDQSREQALALGGLQVRDRPGPGANYWGKAISECEDMGLSFV